MTDLGKGVQRGNAPNTTGVDAPRGGDAGEHNTGAEFGTHERIERGTNGDADRRGISKNQGHGHPRTERGRHGD